MKIHVIDSKSNIMFYVDINFSKYFFNFAPIIMRNEFHYLFSHFSKMRNESMAEYLNNVNDVEFIKELEKSYFTKLMDYISCEIKQYYEDTGIMLYIALKI